MRKVSRDLPIPLGEQQQVSGRIQRMCFGATFVLAAAAEELRADVQLLTFGTGTPIVSVVVAAGEWELSSCSLLSTLPLFWSRARHCDSCNECKYR